GQSARLLWVGQRGGETLVLIDIDFSLGRSDWGGLFFGLPVGFLGQGRVYPQWLRKLRQITRRARQQYPGCTILWIAHIEPEAADHSLALLDDHQLAAALRQEQVAALLCGPTHDSNLTKQFADTPVLVCGTTTQHASRFRNCLHVLEMDVQPPPAGAGLTCTVFRLGIVDDLALPRIGPVHLESRLVLAPDYPVLKGGRFGAPGFSVDRCSRGAGNTDQRHNRHAVAPFRHSVPLVVGAQEERAILLDMSPRAGLHLGVEGLKDNQAPRTRGSVLVDDLALHGILPPTAPRGGDECQHQDGHSRPAVISPPPYHRHGPSPIG